MNALPLVMLLMPLAGCVWIGFGAAPKKTALLVTSFNVLASLVLAAAFSLHPSGEHFSTNIPWLFSSDFLYVHFHIALDGLNLPLVLLTSFVSLAAVAASAEETRRAREFFICLLLISASALGAFLSFDLLFLYLFHEIALVPSFLLIGGWGGRERRAVAWRMALYLIAGSLILLLGLLTFYLLLPPNERTFDLLEIRRLLARTPMNPNFQPFLFLLLLIGCGVLMAMWPFHNWAAQAYAIAPTPVAMLHAGVLKMFGVYVLLRVAAPFLPYGMGVLKGLLLVFLTFNILYVGMIALAQKELNPLLAYSSVAHVGWLLLGLASGNLIGFTGAAFLMAGQGISAALLFSLGNEIQKRTGAGRLNEMGGLASRAPALAFLFIASALASIGLPGFVNFVGEILVFFGAWKAYPWAVCVALVGMILSAVYMLRAVRNIFFGKISASTALAHDLEPLQQWPHWLLLTPLIIVGCWPRLLTQWIQPALEKWLNL
ncbi:MAG: NADH-quinone oxidoreductase subunit M [bacterium]